MAFRPCEVAVPSPALAMPMRSEATMNAIPWDSGQAIYRQLRDRFVAKILEGEPGEGQALPSVRQVRVSSL